ncbi:MAG: hypothetical protein ACRES5_15105 [Pseudomonas sp.]|uniref:hypothetical protein n=1 Tax=Stenotrophomonas sp. TaxID=69392 RepID=UPI003D6D504A
MQRFSSTGRFQHGPRRLRQFVCALAVTVAMSTQSAYAGMQVVDIASILGELRSWMDATTQYAKEASRWKEVKAQIDDARAILDPIRFSMGLPEGTVLRTVNADHLVSEACGKQAAGLEMEAVLPALRFGRREVWEEQQRQICVNIQMMQNRKYNETVLFLESTIEQAETAMLKVFEARQQSGNTSGGVQGADSDTARLTGQLNVMAQQWSTRMQGYDAYISTMQSRQNIVARAALRGDPNAEVAGDVVQTLGLKWALGR